MILISRSPDRLKCPGGFLFPKRMTAEYGGDHPRESQYSRSHSS